MNTTFKTLLVATALCGIMAQTPARAWEGSQTSAYDVITTHRAPGTSLTKADVAAIQDKLKEDGFYRARVDGHYGPVTADAVARFQAASGLPASGRLTVATLNDLGVAIGGTSVAMNPESIEPAAGGETVTHETITHRLGLFPGHPGVSTMDTNNENGAACMTCTNGIIGNGGTVSMRSNEY